MRHSFVKLDDSASEAVTSVDGRRLFTLGKVSVEFVINSHSFPFEAHVIENLAYDVILGRDFLQKFGFKVNFDNGLLSFPAEEDPLPFNHSHDSDSPSEIFRSSVHASRTFVIPPQSEILVLGELNSLPSKVRPVDGMISPRSELHHRYSLFGASELVKVAEDWSVPVRMVNPSSEPVKIYRRTKLADFEEVDQNIATFELSASCETEKTSPKGFNESENNRCDYSEYKDYSQLPDLSGSVLSDGDKVKFRDLFKKYRDVFAFPGDQLGRTSLVQHVIETGDAVPIKQRPYRSSPESKREVDRQVEEMLDKGIVQESVSPWSSPVVLVKKKDGTFRFCVDYRRLNKVTKKDSFPMPLVADALDSLAGTNLFSNFRPQMWFLADRNAPRFT